jgi:hypothetical protein
MARSPIFAIVAACAFALAGCGGRGGYSGFSTSGNSLETVDDAAAIVAHRTTGSQYAAAAIGAVDSVGSLVRELADAGGSSTIGRDCREGSELLDPSRTGDPRSTETREFFDAGCTQLARDTVRTFAPLGTRAESEAVAVSIYARNQAAPLALRLENSRITGAHFDALGFPIVRDGFVRTTTRQLLVSNQRHNVSISQLVMMPSSGDDVNALCASFAGYDAAGIPALDAAFGWQGATIDSPTSIRRDGRNGAVSVSTTQIGNAMAGPIGSLSFPEGTPRAACGNAAAAYALAGATAASAYTIPIRAAYRFGRLSSLTISRALFSGGYTLDLASNARNRTGTVAINGLLTNGKTHVANLFSDVFGSGVLTITSTGAQYRLVDWTVVT